MSGKSVVVQPAMSVNMELIQAFNPNGISPSVPPGPTGPCPSVDWTLQAASDEQTFEGVNVFEYFGTNNTGVAMSKDGQRAAIGTVNWAAPAGAAGSVSVYVLSGVTWSLEQRIVLPGAPDPSFFELGSGVALNEDGTILASATGVSDTTGRLRIYTRVGSVWSLSQNPLATGTHSRFAQNVVMDYKAAVCAICTASNVEQDKVWIFTNIDGTWAQLKIITPTFDAGDGGATGYRGFSMEMSGDGLYLVVGSQFGALKKMDVYYKDEGGADNWGLQQTITGADIDFGADVSVSCDGVYLAAGSPQYSGGSGGVFVYKRAGSTWSLVATVEPTDTATTWGVGSSVNFSPDGRIMLVGGKGYNSNRGVAFVFEDIDADDVWTQNQKIEPALADGDTFGLVSALTPQGGWVAIGAPGFGSGVGKVWFYKIYT